MTNKPLLLYITDATSLGGAEAYLETLLAHVDQERYHVVVALPWREATKPLIGRAQALGVHVVELDTVHHNGLNVLAVVKAHRLLRQLRPAIVHWVLVSPRRCAESVFAAWLAQVPQRIATFQLVTPVPRFAGLSRAVRALNRSLQFRTLTDGIAVCRGNACLLVEQYGFPADRLAIIPNGVDTRAFGVEIDRAAIRAGLGVPATAPLLGLVGRLSHQKGQQVLFQALPQLWAAYPDLHIALVGTGELEQELRAEAARIDQHARIHFLGVLSRQSIPEILAAFDLVVLPSLYEGLPFAAVEAMAAGKPIVATNLDGTSEAIADGGTGLLVPPGEPAPLAHTILRLLADPLLRDQLGNAAQKEAIRRFDQAAMLAATFGMYRGTYSQPSPLHPDP